MMKYFHCTEGEILRTFLVEVRRFDLDVAEYLLNNLCCLPFQINFTRPKNLTLIQIWFLLKKDRSELEKDIQIAQEQSQFKGTLLFPLSRSLVFF